MFDEEEWGRESRCLEHVLLIAEWIEAHEAEKMVHQIA